MVKHAHDINEVLGSLQFITYHTVARPTSDIVSEFAQFYISSCQTLHS